MTINAHFDGKTIVLDEPATLVAGQKLKVVVEPATVVEDIKPVRTSRFGFAKGMIEMRNDFNEPLDDFAEYMRIGCWWIRRR